MSKLVEFVIGIVLINLGYGLHVFDMVGWVLSVTTLVVGFLIDLGNEGKAK